MMTMDVKPDGWFLKYSMATYDELDSNSIHNGEELAEVDHSRLSYKVKPISERIDAIMDCVLNTRAGAEVLWSKIRVFAAVRQYKPGLFQMVYNGNGIQSLLNEEQLIKILTNTYVIVETLMEGVSTDV